MLALAASCGDRTAIPSGPHQTGKEAPAQPAPPAAPTRPPATTPAPPTFNVRLVTVTTGVELDPDGYVITIDADPDAWITQQFGAVGTNGWKESVLAEAGNYYFAFLPDVAPNCTAVGWPRVGFSVGDSVVTLAVECLAIPSTQGVRVTTVTTGAVADTASFELAIVSDSGGTARPFAQTRIICANQTVTMPSRPGSFQVYINNRWHWHLCSQPRGQAVRVEPNLTSSVRFDIACVP